MAEAVSLPAIANASRMAYIVEGPPVTVSRPAPLTSADSESVTFCTKDGEAGLKLIQRSQAGIILCRPSLQGRVNGRSIVCLDNPRLAFIRVCAAYFSPPRPCGIHPMAWVEAGVHLEADVYIGPYAAVHAPCSIGAGSVIHGGVHILGNVTIGEHVTIWPGTIIGADGFGYERSKSGEFEKFPHLGGVVIKDGAEIGANACIDRGSLSNTVIGTRAKIDNLVHVAHNVQIGDDAAVIAHSMIGGSTLIGDKAWIAPSAVLRDQLSIGDRAIVGLGAVVVKDVPSEQIVMGSPARPIAVTKALIAKFNALLDGS